jgi:signal transduction histidine kinase
MNIGHETLIQFYKEKITKLTTLPFVGLMILFILSLSLLGRWYNKKISYDFSERNLVIAEQMLKNFTQSTRLIANSSFTALALKLSDFQGYRNVILPWISDDTTISGIILFDKNGTPSLVWPNNLLSNLNIGELSKINSDKVFQLENGFIARKQNIFENSEYLGALVFFTTSDRVGIEGLFKRAESRSNCHLIPQTENLNICEVSFLGIQTANLVMLGTIFLLLFIFVISHLQKRLIIELIQPLLVLQNGIFKMKGGRKINWENLFREEKTSFFRVIGNDFNKTVQELNDVTETKTSSDNLARIAHQVAHDVRSPLTALSTIMVAQDIPEKYHPLIRSTVDRINKICNDLLAKAKTTDIILPKIELRHALREIIDEKMAEYANLKQIQISFTDEIAEKTNSIWIPLPDAAFKSAISNLINNAIESIISDGKVSVRLRQVGKQIVIQIQDTGVGIPDIVLKDLGKKPITFGKTDTGSGSGIGVLSATKLFRQAEGRLTFKSPEGQGTIVEIGLPVELE